MIVLEERQKESNQIFNPVTIKKSLSKLLQRENARSIYGSTVSRLGGRSCQGSQISTKKAEAAAHLDAKWAEIHQDEISMLREKLKKLENQRDLEVDEAEYNIYADTEGNDVVEEAEERNTLHAGESSIYINKLSSKTPQIASTPIQAKTELNVREDSLVQEFKEALLTSKLPSPEPFVSTGDPLKYTEWSTTFKALIETCCTNSVYKLFYF